MTRRIGWALPLLLVALAVSGLQAHMALKKAEPANGATIATAPTTVTLWFTQEPDLAVSRVTLAGPAGPVKLGAVKVGEGMQLTAPIEGTMTNGAYTLEWQTAGDDGHVQKGSVAFTLNRAQ
jgi:methionine-rich copper-binding protein CopC